MKGCFSSSASVRHFLPRFFEISAEKEEDINDLVWPFSSTEIGQIGFEAKARIWDWDISKHQ